MKFKLTPKQSQTFKTCISTDQTQHMIKYRYPPSINLFNHHPISFKTGLGDSIKAKVLWISTEEKLIHFQTVLSTEPVITNKFMTTRGVEQYD